VLTVTTAKKDMVYKVCVLFRAHDPSAACPLSLGNSSKVFVD